MAGSGCVFDISNRAKRTPVKATVSLSEYDQPSPVTLEGKNEKEDDSFYLNCWMVFYIFKPQGTKQANVIINLRSLFSPINYR